MGSLINRRQDIERAKGLAILLVVFGHIVARADPLRVEWYEPIRRAIYAFHMPFFLYLSGYVAVLSGALFLPPEKWRRLLASRARRLLLPFLALGLLTVGGKIVAGFFVFVDNRPASLVTGLENLFWHTADSPALSIWYLFVLFTFEYYGPDACLAGSRPVTLFYHFGIVDLFNTSAALRLSRSYRKIFNLFCARRLGGSDGDNMERFHRPVLGCFFHSACRRADHGRRFRRRMAGETGAVADWHRFHAGASRFGKIWPATLRPDISLAEAELFHDLFVQHDLHRACKRHSAPGHELGWQPFPALRHCFDGSG